MQTILAMIAEHAPSVMETVGAGIGLWLVKGLSAANAALSDLRARIKAIEDEIRHIKGR